MCARDPFPLIPLHHPQRLFAFSFDVMKYSSDTGVTWTQRFGVSGNIESMACSADGLRAVAGTQNNQLFTTSNAGRGPVSLCLCIT